MDFDVRSLLRRLESANWHGISDSEMELIGSQLVNAYWASRAPVGVGDKVVSHLRATKKYGTVVAISKPRFSLKGAYKVPKVEIIWCLVLPPRSRVHKYSGTGLYEFSSFRPGKVEKCDWPEEMRWVAGPGVA